VIATLASPLLLSGDGAFTENEAIAEAYYELCEGSTSSEKAVYAEECTIVVEITAAGVIAVSVL
jgi:hypothetical protein